MKKIPALLSIMILCTLFAGCILPEKGYEPGIQFTIDKTSVETNDKELSNTIVTVTVKKTDDENLQTPFIVEFIPSNAAYVYPVVNDLRVRNATTKVLQYKGMSDEVQFKVYGEVLPGQPYSPYTISVRLWYNDTLVDVNELVLNVKVNQ